MEHRDDELVEFSANGAPPLPEPDAQGYVENEGARIRYLSCGAGPAAILLHGGLGHGGNWGHQAPELIKAGYRTVLIDSRGHGRSTRDEQPYSYELMASDVVAVMDALSVKKAALIGWSDGACTALVLARRAPGRVAGVFFFACNMDPSGAKEFVPTPIIDRCFSRHRQDYLALSATPDRFQDFVDAVSEMQRTQPDDSLSDLAEVRVPVTIAQAERDEFIRQEHAEYLAGNIPGAEFVLLPGVSHFAPLQRPGPFNAAVLAFLGKAIET
jgi:pimeloyl-ACP methyl ester carboxylesterase